MYTKHVFCLVWVTIDIMHHQHDSLHPLHTHYAVVSISYSCRAQQSAAASTGKDKVQRHNAT